MLFFFLFFFIWFEFAQVDQANNPVHGAAPRNREIHCCRFEHERQVPMQQRLGVSDVYLRRKSVPKKPGWEFESSKCIRSKGSRDITATTKQDFAKRAGVWYSLAAALARKWRRWACRATSQSKSRATCRPLAGASREVVPRDFTRHLQRKRSLAQSVVEPKPKLTLFVNELHDEHR